jgi:hypothetical protein
MELFDSSLAEANTILARIDSAADNDRERAMALSCARSASVTTNSALGRPIGMAISPLGTIPETMQLLCYKFAERDTR